MRRRRADRCLLRASAALDADVPDIAQDLLEEARALDPHHPELEEVTARLLAASTPAAAAGRGARPPRHLVSRALLVLIAFALTLIWAAAGIESADVNEVLEQLLIIAGSATTYVSQSA